MSDQKFEKLFGDTKKKMGDKTKIDFKASDIDKKGTIHIPAKSSVIAEEKENRTCRHAISLSPKENEEFLKTLGIVGGRQEKPAIKMRNIILDYIEEWKMKNKS